MAKNSEASTIRLPCHRAPFYFAPHYLRTEEEWKSNLTVLIQSMMRDTTRPWSWQDRYGEWTITVRFELTELTIGARNGTFSLQEFSEAELFSEADNLLTWVGPMDSPSAFVRELLAEEAPDHLQQEIGRAGAFAEDLVEQMAKRYRVALTEGHAVWQARFGSVLNDFRAIDIDQIQHLRIAPVDRMFDWGIEYNRLDQANGPNGEKLYSLCVVPVSQPKCTASDEAASDRRKKYDWRVIDPVIKKEYYAIKLKPHRTKLELKRRVEAELGMSGLSVPKSTALSQRINKLFSKNF
jgi:hypothetical protein